MLAVLSAGGASSITQLTANTDISRQAVTKHLQVLANAGLVQDLRIGRERLWQFDPTQMEAARQSLEVIGRQWEEALARLKTMAEAMCSHAYACSRALGPGKTSKSKTVRARVRSAINVEDR